MDFRHHPPPEGKQHHSYYLQQQPQPRQHQLQQHQPQHHHHQQQQQQYQAQQHHHQQQQQQQPPQQHRQHQQQQQQPPMQHQQHLHHHHQPQQQQPPLQHQQHQGYNQLQQHNQQHQSQQHYLGPGYNQQQPHNQHQSQQHYQQQGYNQQQQQPHTQEQPHQHLLANQSLLANQRARPQEHNNHQQHLQGTGGASVESAASGSAGRALTADGLRIDGVQRAERTDHIEWIQHAKLRTMFDATRRDTYTTDQVKNNLVGDMLKHRHFMEASNAVVGVIWDCTSFREASVTLQRQCEQVREELNSGRLQAKGVGKTTHKRQIQRLQNLIMQDVGSAAGQAFEDGHDAPVFQNGPQSSKTTGQDGDIGSPGGQPSIGNFSPASMPPTPPTTLADESPLIPASPWRTVQSPNVQIVQDAASRFGPRADLLVQPYQNEKSEVEVLLPTITFQLYGPEYAAQIGELAKACKVTAVPGWLHRFPAGFIEYIPRVQGDIYRVRTAPVIGHPGQQIPNVTLDLRGPPPFVYVFCVRLAENLSSVSTCGSGSKEELLMEVRRVVEATPWLGWKPRNQDLPRSLLCHEHFEDSIGAKRRRIYVEEEFKLAEIPYPIPDVKEYCTMIIAPHQALRRSNYLALVQEVDGFPAYTHDAPRVMCTKQTCNIQAVYDHMGIIPENKLGCTAFVFDLTTFHSLCHLKNNRRLGARKVDIADYEKQLQQHDGGGPASLAFVGDDPVGRRVRFKGAQAQIPFGTASKLRRFGTGGLVEITTDPSKTVDICLERIVESAQGGGTLSNPHNFGVRLLKETPGISRSVLTGDTQTCQPSMSARGKVSVPTPIGDLRVNHPLEVEGLFKGDGAPPRSYFAFVDEIKLGVYRYGTEGSLKMQFSSPESAHVTARATDLMPTSAADRERFHAVLIRNTVTGKVHAFPGGGWHKRTSAQRF